MSRSILSMSVAFLLASGCGSDGDSDTESESDPSTEDGSADDGSTDDGSADDGSAGDGSGDGDADGADGDGAADGSDGGDGEPGADLAASCSAFCDAQAECLGYTAAQCTADCMSQADMLTSLDCSAEGAAENECMASLSCEELMEYGAQGRRSHPRCGEAARDYFAACTVGESAACTAMCARYDACDALGVSVGACEESCLLRIANLTWSVSEDCAEGFSGLASCIAEASCEDLRDMTTSGAVPASCAEEDAAQQAVCS